MNVRSLLLSAVLAALALGGGAAPATSEPACTLDRATGTAIDRAFFLQNVSGSRWNVPSDRIAFASPDAAGYYHIGTVRSDGGDRRDLPGTQPTGARKHDGSPYWSPDGRYLLFTAQDADWSGRSTFGVPDYEALPGFGRHDRLYVLDVARGRATPLTPNVELAGQGVLIPVFSPDGTRVAWSVRRLGGSYDLEVAEFAATPEPHLTHERTYRPGGAAYYETGSFSSDGSALFYTSDQTTHQFLQSQIYRLDLATGASTQLTHGNYNEHPTVVKTPTGDWIVYMSTQGVERFPGHLALGTDWYAMKPDGSSAKRLTTMNVRGSPEDFGFAVAGTVSIAPNGTYMLGDLQTSLIRQTGNVRTVRFTCSRSS